MLLSLASRRALQAKTHHLLVLRRFSTMATSHKIFVDAQNIGLWRKVKQTDEAAGKVTELLQKDLEVNFLLPFLGLGLMSRIGLTNIADTPCLLQP